MTTCEEKSVRLRLPFKKSPDSCANAIFSVFVCGNEMRGWSLADDNEVKETNNLSPVGFSNINN